MESQVSGKRELITKGYGVLCADDDNWASLGNSQDITGNGGWTQSNQTHLCGWIQNWCSLVHQCICVSFFQKEMSLRFFGGWGCNLLLRIFSNSRPGKKQRLSLILNVLLVVQVIKTEKITRASNNVIICTNSNRQTNNSYHLYIHILNHHLKQEQEEPGWNLHLLLSLQIGLNKHSTKMKCYYHL